MSSIKRVLSLLLIFIFLFTTLVACGDSGCDEGDPPNNQTVTKETPLNFVKTTGKVANPSNETTIKVIRGGKKLQLGEDEYGDPVYEANDIAIVGQLQSNDIIEVMADYCFIKVNFFEELGEAIIYSPTGEFVFQIPDQSKYNASNNPSPYSANTFNKSSNTLEATVATDEEIQESRNLAANPYDFMYVSETNSYSAALNTLPEESIAIENGEVLAFPHAYGNRVTDAKAIFLARNAIDGDTRTGNNHYTYGYQSWGCGKNSDARFVVYFGRDVEVEELVFVLRADFSGTPPHDSYWEEITVQFDDGTEEIFEFERTGDKQEKTLSTTKTTSYIMLKDFKTAETPASQGWAALTELEVIGKDTFTENPVATKTKVKNTFGNKEIVVTTDDYSAEEIKQWIDDGFNYAINMTTDAHGNSVKIQGLDWRVSGFYVGLIDSYTTTGIEDHYLFMRNQVEVQKYNIRCTKLNDSNNRGKKIKEINGLRPGYDGTGDVSDFADDYLIGEAYLLMNEMKPNAAKVFNAYVNAELNVANKPDLFPNFNEGTINKNSNTLNWWWCDALYMGMNYYTLMSKVTGDPAYVQKAFDSYMYWKNKLYNEEWNLWHRDSNQIGKKTTSGKPVFWSRGNAWVVAALAKQLIHLNEEDFPEIYETYKQDLITYAETLKQYQRDDGTWDASITDTNFYGGPETTGTCGYLYGYCIGMQLGILDYDEYMPVVNKIWDALTGFCNINDEPGRIGYMQWVGYEPNNYVSEAYTRPLSNPFGYGLYLMGATALMRMCSDYEVPEVIVSNDPQWGFEKLPEYFIYE